MSNERLDIALSLENTENNLGNAFHLLSCFLEFTSEESYIPENSSKEDKLVCSLSFIERLEQYESLIRSTMGILDTERQNILAASNRVCELSKVVG